MGSRVKQKASERKKQQTSNLSLALSLSLAGATEPHSSEGGDVDNRAAVRLEDAEVLLKLLSALRVLVEHIRQEDLHRLIRALGRADAVRPPLEDPPDVSRCVVGRGDVVPCRRPSGLCHHHRDPLEPLLLHRCRQGIQHHVEHVGVLQAVVEHRRRFRLEEAEVQVGADRVTDEAVEGLHVHHERRPGLRQELQHRLDGGEAERSERAVRRRRPDGEDLRGTWRRELDAGIQAQRLQRLVKVVHGRHEVRGE